MDMNKPNKFIDGLTKVAGKLSTNNYIMAVRDGFAGTIPITITAAFFLLINNVLLADKTGFLRNMPGHTILSNIGVQAYNGTLGILTVLVTFLIGFRLANYLKSDGATAGIVSVACYVALIPNTIAVTTMAGKTVNAAGVLTQSQTSATAMILGIIASLLGTTILVKFNGNDKLQIKMPDGVPPAVAKAFSSLFPAFFTITIFAAVEEIVVALTHSTVPDIIVKVLQAPLVGGFQSLPGILLYVFLATVVFIFGIHGAFVFGAISGPILLTSLQQNIDAVKAGHAATNIVTQPFLDAYVYMGGGGTMLCLVIAILIFSRRKDERMIANIGGVASLFNISEPMMFGVPIVFNPIYAIPFVVAPMVATIMAYAATAWHLVNTTYILIPWVTPPIISGYLATGGDVRASILQILTLVVGTLIYAPFVMVSNRAFKKQQAKDEMLQAEPKKA
ncbi:PTS beta-glucoside transporter subunit IIC [Lactiplantibacillus fabifermentans T30PCM01]|uniref:Permease IIC component n=1 Tax=Lactiplantibacillus fabifermentans T30PCM01 TaxID=1400520 RepID=W6TBP3_9LACO|nr:PTS sugar transporter subunit IIC [Lactiplantibacillus fabifermentans]ETY72990.1 PTS beta-glucoside transporter subunit IIC [Lactiplantibacillus fabifermentans T30PCM01]